MAIFQRVNGDAAPVFALDIQNGPANVANALIGVNNTVQPAGPKLDFFQLTVTGAAAAGGQGVNSVTSNALQAIQQLGTVAMYQVDTGNLVSIAVYPTGAFSTDGSVGANIRATVGATCTAATNVGFKLAAS